MEDCIKFFENSTPPNDYSKTCDDINAFCVHHANLKNKIALVTSGGTRVPLEANAVRFIDNFSEGKRGSASAEHFLSKSYAVIFVYRKGTIKPYLRFLETEQIMSNVIVESDSKLIINSNCAVKAWQHYQKFLQSKFLLCVQFQTLVEYLYLLKAVGKALQPLEKLAITYLAAAVSDFFIPQEKLTLHKIQSADGPITLHLAVVPKLLKPLVGEWAPKAFHISFKLETDENILIDKAKKALASYGHQLVIANLLHNYNRVVIMVEAGGNETSISLTEKEMSDAIEIESKIVDFIVEKHANFIFKI